MATTDAQVVAAEASIRRAVNMSPDDATVWEDMGEVQVLLAKRAGAELMRRASASVTEAASAAAATTAAAAASRPARTLEEFRRRARRAEMEAQRKALQGAASEPAVAPEPAPSASAPPSMDELKGLVRTHFEAARDAYLRSIELRPQWPAVWARIAGVYFGLEQRELYLQAWRKALKLGPNEGNVQAECLELVLLDWDQAETDQTEWAKKLFETATPAKRSVINKLAVRFGIRFDEEDEAADAAGAASVPATR